MTVKPDYENLDLDVLILDGDGAGLMAALHAWKKRPDLRIAVAAKGLLGQSGCTRMVQGGDNVGLIRGNSGLRAALSALDELAVRLDHSPVPPRREYNLTWQGWLNVRSILTVARLTCSSAVARTESRGSRYRTDHPEPKDDLWLRNVLVQRTADGSPRLWDEPVVFTRVRPGDSPP